MSTPNFALTNASRYFVLGMPVYYTQEEIDERELDQDLLGEFDELGTEFNYDAVKGNVAYELKAKGWHDIEECDGDRNYPTSLFSEKPCLLSAVTIPSTLRFRPAARLVIIWQPISIGLAASKFIEELTIITKRVIMITTTCQPTT